MSIDAPLTAIDLPTHARNVLAGRGVTTLCELHRLVTDRSILAMRGVDGEVLNEIEQALDNQLRVGDDA
jgi:hypothetical protein